MTAAERVRRATRADELHRATAGLAPEFVQANLVAVPASLAEDFRRYCEANPRPCPLLEAVAPGGAEPALTAPGADLRTDLARYRVYREGSLAEERTEVWELWDEGTAAFLLGCSYTFERPLLEAGFGLPHARAGRPVSMYRTEVATEPAGPFRGPLVVSMRPVPEERVQEAAEITARYPLAHGEPLHAGDPAGLGIRDLARPDYGEPWLPEADELPVFWACGVTPQAAAVASELKLVITHAPGHMFVTDLRAEELRDVEVSEWDPSAPSPASPR